MLILGTIVGFFGFFAALYAIVRVTQLSIKKVPPVEMPADGLYQIRTISIDTSTGNRTVEFIPVDEKK